MRFFNTAGPVVPENNYHIPPLERLDRSEIFWLISQHRYFILHAPRQTGKTSALLVLCKELNATGQYRAIYANIETAQTAREDVAAGIQAILSTLGREIAHVLEDHSVEDAWPDVLTRDGPHTALSAMLEIWSAADPRPTILMLDEVDALIGDTLISVLRQLRAGYPNRPGRFPQSVILCGIRDVRDYRIHSRSENAIISGGSAFNIKAESLRLGDFDETQVRKLLLQHTDETGQRWSEAALSEAWHSTQGQPWLVNALAHEAWKKIRDRTQTIRSDDMLEAREELIRRRDTHLDQLADKLREERVRRVIEPLLSGNDEPDAFLSDDVQYIRDLGLISQTRTIEIANPIYREVIPRELITSTDEVIPYKTAWFVKNGVLLVDGLLKSFQEFFREHSEHWVKRFDYQEAGPQLLLQAFLQRIVNAGGRIEREYGLGRRRTDLLIIWGSGKDQQKAVIECKLRRNGLMRTIHEGLEQTAAYMDLCGSYEGHLVIFDRSDKRSWDEKIFSREESAGDRSIIVWGM